MIRITDNLGDIYTLTKPIVIAHRGASSDAPENTMKAFSRAIEIGADMIELDIHMTLDNQLVCIHDNDLDRTTNGTGFINELTLEEIQSYDAGDGQIVPSLEKVLALCKDRIMLDIELKEFDIEQNVLSVVERYKMLEEVIFSSFYHGSVLTLKKLNTSCRTAILFDSPIEDIVDYALSIQANAINPPFDMIDIDLVESVHSAGLQVYPWTVNSKATATKLLTFEVDGLITDEPEMMKRLISHLY
jgi:glycerophosphoryl diester phosphodiesterase